MRRVVPLEYAQNTPNAKRMNFARRGNPRMIMMMNAHTVGLGNAPPFLWVPMESERVVLVLWMALPIRQCVRIVRKLIIRVPFAHKDVGTPDVFVMIAWQVHGCEFVLVMIYPPPPKEEEEKNPQGGKNKKPSKGVLWMITRCFNNIAMSCMLKNA
jgi:hypothetical protein